MSQQHGEGVLGTYSCFFLVLGDIEANCEHCWETRVCFKIGIFFRTHKMSPKSTELRGRVLSMPSPIPLHKSKLLSWETEFRTEMFNTLVCQISSLTSQLFISLQILSEKNHNRFHIKPDCCLRGIKKKNHTSVLFFFCSKSPLKTSLPFPMDRFILLKGLESQGENMLLFWINACYLLAWRLVQERLP